MAQNCIVSLLLVTIQLLAPVLTEDYCKINCNGGKHTMCLFTSASSECVKLERTGSVRDEMLKAHNEFRNQFANQEYPGQKDKGFPKAANMRQMYWDPELEEIARRWAEQCQYGHDACRTVSRFSVGQNVGIRSRYPSPPDKSKETFKSWVGEMKDADDDVQKEFKSTGKMIGHFTQVAWAGSYLLGCAEVLYDSSNMRNRYVVCNYGPAGNVLGQPMYRKGDPCSKCPSGLKCGGTYSHLCADPNKPDSDSSSGRLSAGFTAFVALTTAILK